VCSTTCTLLSDIISDIVYPDIFIVIDIELPFKCNPEVFEKFIRRNLKAK